MHEKKLEKSSPRRSRPKVSAIEDTRVELRARDRSEKVLWKAAAKRNDRSLNNWLRNVANEAAVAELVKPPPRR
jgi:uncharacterized protein (DUF1778 family)